jgi:hypothetical protein
MNHLRNAVELVERVLHYEQTDGQHFDGYDIALAEIATEKEMRPITLDLAIMIVANRQGTLE